MGGVGVLAPMGPRRRQVPRGLRPTTGLTQHLGDEPKSLTLWPEGPQRLSSQPLRGQTFSFGPLFILSSAQTIDKPVIWLLMKFCTEQHGVTVFGSKMSLEHMPLNAWYAGLTFCLMHNSQAVADLPNASPKRRPGGHLGSSSWGVGMVTLELLNKANVASRPLQTFNIFQRCVDALTAIFISKCPHLVSSMHKILAPTPHASLLPPELPRAPGSEHCSVLRGEGALSWWLQDYLGAHHSFWGSGEPLGKWRGEPRPS